MTPVALIVLLATWWTLMTSSSTNDVRIPRPCTDLAPIDLLQEAVPRVGLLPPGVAVIYDVDSHVHAFQFQDKSSPLSFSSSRIFTRCQYFPEEFSLFLVLRHTKRPRRRECIISLVDARMQNNIVALSYSGSRLVFRYRDQTLRFKTELLRDGRWHTLGFSLAGSTVEMTTDCTHSRKRRVRRPFPAFLPTDNSSFLIGRCKRRRTNFQGDLKDVILVPGADAVVRACPPRKPVASSIHDNTIPQMPMPPDSSGPWPERSHCTWRDAGNLAFDLHRQQLKVCVNGIWQRLSLKSELRKLDYLSDHQDVALDTPAIDVEVFTVPGEGTFAAFAGSNGGSSPVFRWTEQRRLEAFQTLETEAAHSICFFSVRNQFFLAVANYGSAPDIPSNSTIFRWHKRRRKFKRYQLIPTWTARDFEYFEIDGDHYLAVANYAEGNRNMVDSVIYKWSRRSRKFEEDQRLLTTGAYDFTYFQVDGFHFLAVANAFSGLSTLVDSVIYVWRNGVFVQLQSMETNGATDWEFFTIGDQAFLVVANAFNYGPQNFRDVDTYLTNSTLYRLNKQRRVFEKFQEITTFSAIDWEYFRVGEDHFLVVSNAQNGGSDERLRSAIYRWQGMDKFVRVHNMATLPSSDFEVLRDGEDVFLIYSNPKNTSATGSTSQVLKVKFV